jgi:hypothetical protein
LELAKKNPMLRDSADVRLWIEPARTSARLLTPIALIARLPEAIEG